MKILSKKSLVSVPGSKVTQIVLSSPDIAAKALPGEFVVIMADKKGERVPLTIVNADKKNGTVTLIFQEAGLSTTLLGKMNVGDSLYAMVGPLGHATPIKNYGKIILVGGGVGIAEIYPVAAALKDAGNHVTTILGARSKDILILEQELKKASDEFYVATDDGSYGVKGFTTDLLRERLSKGSYDVVYAVGPIPMMKKVTAVTKEFNVKTVVSLNALMVDGTGMCGGCRVTIGGQVKFTCVDGPEFDGQLVDWNELEKRNKVYFGKEKHVCELDKVAK
ncbi:MAG TPA: sulfide/dihydroorotate dehydrogenase-like FAD/NAD-binding protein [Candidatus Omnitrophota bacterium]|nr:sulfide/dihydroorotate dehydrogenase-like FAD/NAD-binding protein [Candidatus Omnitrophota bacterium]HPD85448.1 sulfide/dihydroorotate dehydrogenase-like FAD/NAD-binding protein [Candidatus Omnitrophota bacterium]HRZ04051.1 sulfide/dihydroorotate dehydrogenase-like FAD/NAD-binding protein [Candidatus Omnitrophota bacterium]